MKKIVQPAATLLLLLLLHVRPSPGFAQGTVLTYQGRLTERGTNFTGAGQFKFALVTSSNANQTATATANAPSGGYITGYAVTAGGNGYVTAPAVTVFGGGGSGAAAHANITGGVVTSLTVDNTGNGGYTNAPTVLIAPPPPNLSYVTYWSNDGASVNGSEPAAAVSVNVSNGLFTAVLGDTTQPNMSGINSALFAQPNLQLRIWFNDGVQGSVALDPAQNLTPAPYAIAAASVNATNISAGTLPDARLSSNVPRLDATQTFTGVNTFNNDAGVTGTLSVNTIAPASTLSVAGDMQMSGGYHHFALDGGNSTGFLYGSYPAFGDGVHLGYNYYADAGGVNHVINAGGGTSRISAGYGYIQLITAGVNTPPTNNWIGLTVVNGTVGINTPSPNRQLEVNGIARINNDSQINAYYWDLYAGGSALYFTSQTGNGAYISATDGSYHQYSDVRLKRDIANLDHTLDRLLQLRPVSYHFRSAPTNAPLSLGLLAQEVEPLFPEVVSDGQNGMKGLAYSELVPVTIGAIQELNQKLEAKVKEQAVTMTELENLCAGMRKELAEQNRANARLQARFEKLEKASAGAAEVGRN